LVVELVAGVEFTPYGPRWLILLSLLRLGRWLWVYLGRLWETLFAPSVVNLTPLVRRVLCLYCSCVWLPLWHTARRWDVASEASSVRSKLSFSDLATRSCLTLCSHYAMCCWPRSSLRVSHFTPLKPIDSNFRYRNGCLGRPSVLGARCLFIHFITRARARSRYGP